MATCGVAAAVFAQDEPPDISASSQPHRFEMIDTVLDWPTIEAVIVEWGLDQSQSENVERIWRDYLDAAAQLDRGVAGRRRDAGLDRLNALDAELMPGPPRRAVEPSGRRPTEEAIAADDPRWEELRDLRAAMGDVTVSAQRQGDAFRADCVRSMASSLGLNEDEAASLERFVLRRVMRKTFSAETHDFRRHADMLALAGDSTESGELARTMAGLSHEDIAEIKSVIDAALLDYERRWHAHLNTILRARRQRFDPDQPFVIAFTDPRAEEVLERHRRGWLERHRMSYETMSIIEQALINVGDIEAASAWRERYYAAVCPQLTKPRFLDDLPGWMDRLEGVTAEQIDAADLLVNGYPAREVRSDDKSLVLQFDRNESVSVECHFDLMPAPRLRRIESESRGRDGTSFAGLVMNRHVFEIDEWQVFEDIGAIPARAWFFSAAVRHPSLPPEQPVSVSVVELIRMSATALPDVDEFDRWFDPPLAELGFLVYDERSNLSYAIGRDRIAVDGRLFQLAEPIAGLIDGRLPDYLGEAAREISGSIPAVLQKAEEEDDG